VAERTLKVGAAAAACSGDLQHKELVKNLLSYLQDLLSADEADPYSLIPNP